MSSADGFHVDIRQTEGRGADDAVELIRTARAHDGGRHGGMSERPRNRGLAGGFAVSCADGLEPLRQLEPLREIRLLKYLAFLRQSLAGIAANRSCVMVPVSRPDCIGE